MLRRAIPFLLLMGPGFAQQHPATLTFEVASIKPANPDIPGGSIQFMPGGGLKMTGMPLRGMITFAYDVRDFQVSGGPGWMGTERFDVMARPDAAAAVDGQVDFAKMNDNQRKTMRDQITERLRALLADRFQLAVHKETKDQPIYALVVSKNGSKLQETKETGTQQSMMTNRGRSQGHAIPVEMIAQMLSGITGRPVVDKTGLTAKYDFVLEWTPDAGADARAQGFGDGINTPAPAPGGPTIFTALQEQLGLKLEAQKGPVQNIVIDRAEKPSEN